MNIIKVFLKTDLSHAEFKKCIIEEQAFTYFMTIKALIPLSDKTLTCPNFTINGTLVYLPFHSMSVRLVTQIQLIKFIPYTEDLLTDIAFLSVSHLQNLLCLYNHYY